MRTPAVCFCPQFRGWTHGLPQSCALKNRARGLTFSLLWVNIQEGTSWLVAEGVVASSPHPALNQSSRVGQFWYCQPF